MNRIKKAGNATLSQVSVDPVLTNMSVSFTQDSESFAHHRVFPVLPVDEENGKYFVFNRDDIFRTEAGKRAPGTLPNQKTLSLAQQAYSCTQWALDMNLPDELRASKDSPLADDQSVVEQLTLDLLISREKEFASAYLQTGIWGTDASGVASSPTGTQFIQFNQSGATIIENFRTWVRTVRRQCGRKPNKALISADVWDVISDNASVINRQIYTSSEPVSTEWFANMVGIDEVIVPEAIENTAAQGLTYSGSDIISDTIGIFYSEPTPSKMRPSAGYTFSWTEFDEVRADLATTGAAAIKQFRDEALEADRFRAKSYYDFGVVAASCGLLASNVLA